MAARITLLREIWASAQVRLKEHKFSTATHTTLPIDSDNISSNETVGLFLSKQPHDVSTFRYGLAMGTLSNGNSYIQSLSSDNSGRKLLLNPNVVGYVGIGTSNPEYQVSTYKNTSISGISWTAVAQNVGGITSHFLANENFTLMENMGRSA